MTDPRSIDELFKNTFDNLPDSPADSGWDTPSERVWQHVRENIKPPRSGWNIQSILILAGFAATLAVGLYFVYSAPKKPVPAPVVATAPVVAEKESTAAPVAAPVTVQPETIEPAAAIQPQRTIQSPKQRSHPTAHLTTVVAQPVVEPVKETVVAVEAKQPVTVVQVEKEAAPEVVNHRDLQRTSGAAPLPGSKQGVIPNTTEERKAERARQLEKRWKTPLDLLPIRRTNKQ